MTTTTTSKQHAAALAAIARHTEQVDELERALGDLAARDQAAEAQLVAAEKTVRQAEAAVQRAHEAHRTAEAARLIAEASGDGATAGDAVRAAGDQVSAAQAALAAAQAEAERIRASVKATLGAIAAERAQVQSKRSGAAALKAELERQAAAAHAVLGREELERIGEAYTAIASEMGVAYAALEAARSALDTLEGSLVERLAAWPELRGEVDAHAPTTMLHSFDMLASQSNWLGAFYAGAGKAAAVPTTLDDRPARVPLYNLGVRLDSTIEQGITQAAIVGMQQHQVRQLDTRRQALAPHVAAAAVAARPEAAPEASGGDDGGAAA